MIESKYIIFEDQNDHSKGNEAFWFESVYGTGPFDVSYFTLELKNSRKKEDGGALSSEYYKHEHWDD